MQPGKQDGCWNQWSKGGDESTRLKFSWALILRLCWPSTKTLLVGNMIVWIWVLHEIQPKRSDTKSKGVRGVNIALRVHETLSVPLTGTRAPSRPCLDCAHSPTWPPAATHIAALWTRVTAWARTFGSNYLTANEHVREPVFFVWQRREAPKDWPWLTKNQRWVPFWNHSAALFYYARSWSLFFVYTYNSPPVLLKT